MTVLHLRVLPSTIDARDVMAGPAGAPECRVGAAAPVGSLGAIGLGAAAFALVLALGSAIQGIRRTPSRRPKTGPRGQRLVRTGQPPRWTDDNDDQYDQHHGFDDFDEHDVDHGGAFFEHQHEHVDERGAEHDDEYDDISEYDHRRHHDDVRNLT
jgi:hypothetical protein